MSFAPEENFDESDSSSSSAAAERVSVPGILLIIVGVLNLLSALLTGFVVLTTAMTPLDQLAQRNEAGMEVVKKMFPDMAAELEKQGKQDPQALKNQGIMTYGIWTALLLLVGIIPIVGGVRMRGLHGYGLAIAGSILAIFPCISGGCCLIIGPVAGIWSLVVLANADVKSAFR
jgi:hypothetical protein